MFSRSTQRNQNDSCTAKKSFQERRCLSFYCLPSCNPTKPFPSKVPTCRCCSCLNSTGTKDASPYVLDTEINFSTVVNQTSQLKKTSGFIPGPPFCSPPPTHKSTVPSHCLQRAAPTDFIFPTLVKYKYHKIYHFDHFKCVVHAINFIEIDIHRSYAIPMKREPTFHSSPYHLEAQHNSIIMIFISRASIHFTQHLAYFSNHSIFKTHPCLAYFTITFLLKAK